MWIELAWRVGMALALGVWLLPQARRSQPAVPMFTVLTGFLLELLMLVWAMGDGWLADMRLTWLIGFVLIGCLLIWHHFGTLRWYYLKGLRPAADPLLYEALAAAIRDTLWRMGCAPAAVLFRDNGYLGIRDLSEEQQDAIMDAIHEVLEAQPALRFHSRWRWFLGFQWMVIAATLFCTAMI